MKFQCVRRSNDGYTWLTLGVYLCGVIGIGYIALFIFFTDSVFLKLLVSALWVLPLYALAWSVRPILFPFEWELVVEGDQIRWGRSDSPYKQRRVSVARLVRLIHDESDSQVLADAGSWQLLHVGDEVLVRPDDQSALVEYLRQSFPQLRIEIA